MTKFGLAVALLFLYSITSAQSDIAHNKKVGFGLEVGGLIYSNTEIGAFTGINMKRDRSNLSFIVAPLFITDQNIVRPGGTLSIRTNISPAGETQSISSYTEFGLQYFEIHNESGHYQKTVLLNFGLCMSINFTQRQALLYYFGAGYDFGGPFVKERPGFVGILRVSYMINDLVRI